MSRLKVGVIGCGAIAQVQHLPHMRELAELFEIRALCDLSRKLLAAVGEEYDVPPERRFTDYNAMLTSDVEAVIVCPSASHAEPSIAAHYLYDPKRFAEHIEPLALGRMADWGKAEPGLYNLAVLR